MSHLIRGVLYDAGRKPLAFHTFDIAQDGEKFAHRDAISFEAFRKAQNKLRDGEIPKCVEFTRFAHIGLDAKSFDELQGVNAGLPVQHHADIYKFYRAIGWNYTTKKFWSLARLKEITPVQLGDDGPQ
jgi:hypothetical protein